MPRLRTALEVFVWSRAAIWIAMLLAYATFEARFALPLHPPVKGPEPPRDVGWGFDIWARWDGGWFTDIARDGYTDPKTGEFVRASSVALMNMVRSDADSERRRAAFAGLRSIETFALEHDYAEIVKLRNRFARKLGHVDYYDYKVQWAEGFDKKTLFGFLDELEQRTREHAREEIGNLARREGDDALEPLSSGTLLGLTDPTTANGRTLFSAGLTLGLLILPLIIINSQEAIRAVSNALRQASYGLGATKWQTIWHHVLPNALPGILTGTILAISRAIGETAPLVVVGASTFITVDPDGPFDKFTTLPIQIYQWTARPQDEFRNIAAAAILVLLALLLTLNASAVLMRNRFSRRV